MIHKRPGPHDSSSSLIGFTYNISEQKLEKKNEKSACIVFCFALTYYNFKAFMFPSGTF
jgi:hypothetical protein